MKKIYYGIPLLLVLGIITGYILHSKTPFSQKKPISKQNSVADKDLADFYQQSQNLTSREEENKQLTFLAVGDISLSRNIAQVIKTSGNPFKPFLSMEELLLSTDFNFGNLETPFSKSDAFTPQNTLTFNAPKANIVGLTKYKFSVLNLANNHAFDQGLNGITTTRDILDANGLAHMGTGQTLEEAWQPVIIEKNGIKIGFIGASYSSINDGGKATNNYVARIEDTQQLISQVSFLKSQTDFIVVTMHAGTEYTRTPNAGQIAFARAAVDAGANIVIGAHPHWIQTIEKYKDTYIFYSLGNFIFDQNWSQDTREGLTLKIRLEKPGRTSLPGATEVEDLQGNRTPAHIASIELIPVIIDENCCPRPALSVEAAKILKKIEQESFILK